MLRVLVISHYYWPENFRINQAVEDLPRPAPSGRAHRPALLSRRRHLSGYDRAEPPSNVMRRAMTSTGSRSSAARPIISACSSTTSRSSSRRFSAGAGCCAGRRFDVLFVYGTSAGHPGLCRPLAEVGEKGEAGGLGAGSVARGARGDRLRQVRLPLRLVGGAVSALYRRSDLILGQSRAFASLIAARAGRTPVEYFPNPGEHPVTGAGLPAPRSPTGSTSSSPAISARRRRWRRWSSPRDCCATGGNTHRARSARGRWTNGSRRGRRAARPDQPRSRRPLSAGGDARHLRPGVGAAADAGARRPPRADGPQQALRRTWLRASRSSPRSMARRRDRRAGWRRHFLPGRGSRRPRRRDHDPQVAAGCGAGGDGRRGPPLLRRELPAARACPPAPRSPRQGRVLLERLRGISGRPAR